MMKRLTLNMIAIVANPEIRLMGSEASAPWSGIRGFRVQFVACDDEPAAQRPK